VDVEAAIQRVKGWVAELDVGVRAEPERERVVLEASCEVSKAEVDLTTIPAAPSFTALVEQLVEGRAGLLTCEVTGSQESYRIDLAHPVYVDGLSRHTVMAAASEVTKTRAGIDRLRDSIVTQRQLIDQFKAPAGDSVVEIDEATTSEGEAPTWTPTHVVPEGGMPAWASPDPSAQAVATLAAGTQLQVQEWQEGWARVAASNGWSGWVDGRRLLPNR
jgi:hypothetical protein